MSCVVLAAIAEFKSAVDDFKSDPVGFVFFPFTSNSLAPSTLYPQSGSGRELTPEEQIKRNEEKGK